jgi:Zn-dependent peptidase ImmA (M78 family)/transcriptional regulator with XRE-family HTH domain
MMVDNREVGARIRRLRLAVGLGQVDFAERLGVASGSVSKLENGRMQLSDQLLAEVAAALESSPRFLTATVGHGPVSRPWLRAYADASKRAIDRQMADSITATEFVEVMRLRPIPDSVPVFHGDLAHDDDIEQFAHDVRSAAQLQEGDVVGNSIRAAERLGCLVLPMSEELGRHVGLSTRANQIPIISVIRGAAIEGTGVPGDRQRFTVAHELGHLALHSGLGPPSSADDASRIERQAHRFAGAFLAPGDALLEDLQELGGRVTLNTLATLKGRWGVSIRAFVMRFQALGLIDAEQARSLHKQISARGWGKAEPVFVGTEEAVWLRKALERQNSGNDDVVGRAVTAAGLGPSHIRRWLDWTAPREIHTDGQVVSLRDHARSRAAESQARAL